jgi:adenine phosphoribosyltransferase
LVEELGGEVAGLVFLVELTFLNGREKLPARRIETLVRY